MKVTDTSWVMIVVVVVVVFMIMIKLWWWWWRSNELDDNNEGGGDDVDDDDNMSCSFTADRCSSVSPVGPVDDYYAVTWTDTTAVMTLYDAVRTDYNE